MYHHLLALLIWPDRSVPSGATLEPAYMLVSQGWPRAVTRWLEIRLQITQGFLSQQRKGKYKLLGREALGEHFTLPHMRKRNVHFKLSHSFRIIKIWRFCLKKAVNAFVFSTCLVSGIPGLTNSLSFDVCMINGWQHTGKILAVSLLIHKYWQQIWGMKTSYFSRLQAFIYSLWVSLFWCEMRERFSSLWSAVLPIFLNQ